jgi:hypothetical protein
MQGGNGVLSAECADTQGRFHISTLQYSACHGEVGNNNGLLACSGASASGGALVDNGNNGGGNERQDNNNSRRDNNAGAAAAGLIAGLALNQGGNVQVYNPGYSYPTYGDQHYGDPRFDPRYGPRGWGAGHRPGEWVWIRDRADWLNRQIDREVQDGVLRRRQAGDLRQQLGDLEHRETDYSRRGLTNWMKADLDKRFDQIAALVFDARRDGGPPPPPGDGYDHGYRAPPPPGDGYGGYR